MLPFAAAKKKLSSFFFSFSVFCFFSSSPWPRDSPARTSRGTTLTTKEKIDGESSKKKRERRRKETLVFFVRCSFSLSSSSIFSVFSPFSFLLNTQSVHRLMLFETIREESERNYSRNKRDTQVCFLFFDDVVLLSFLSLLRRRDGDDGFDGIKKKTGTKKTRLCTLLQRLRSVGESRATFARVCVRLRKRQRKRTKKKEKKQNGSTRRQ